MGINGGENGMFVDYDHSIVSLSCSILKHYGAEYHHKTFEPMDELLQHPYKHVVIMLFEGLGMEVLRRHLPENSFLRSHALGGNCPRSFRRQPRPRRLPSRAA